MSFHRKIELREKPILVTGVAGFIGFHLAKVLLDQGQKVVGIDIVNDYYDVTLKEDRLAQLTSSDLFKFHRIDMADAQKIKNVFDNEQFSSVVNLAAQAGVRHSINNPESYINSNLIGFFNILQNCRLQNVDHFVYASSSSVYGLNKTMPFSAKDNVDHPISLYAASKKSNELMAHSYSHLFGLPTTGLRFFTVYGPWGRPDMALFKFCRSIMMDEPLTLFNFGKMQRDFTYIDDIVNGILNVIETPPAANPDWSGDNPDPSSAPSPFRIYNIGAGSPVELMRFLELIEKEMGKKAIVEKAPIQPGDVPATSADIDGLVNDTGYHPQVSVEEGIKRFVEWFKDYYGNGKTIPS